MSVVWYGCAANHGFSEVICTFQASLLEVCFLLYLDTHFRLLKIVFDDCMAREITLIYSRWQAFPGYSNPRTPSAHACRNESRCEPHWPTPTWLVCGLGRVVLRIYVSRILTRCVDCSSEVERYSTWELGTRLSLSACHSVHDYESDNLQIPSNTTLPSIPFHPRMVPMIHLLQSILHGLILTSLHSIEDFNLHPISANIPFIAEHPTIFYISCNHHDMIVHITHHWVLFSSRLRKAGSKISASKAHGRSVRVWRTSDSPPMWRWGTTSKQQKAGRMECFGYNAKQLNS